jgi:hypothetical protein
MRHMLPKDDSAEPRMQDGHGTRDAWLVGDVDLEVKA